MSIVIAVVALILISAFFSLSETAITGADKGKLYKDKLEGKKKAIKVLNLLDKKDKLITTILLCNTAVNAGASALTTAFFIDLFGDIPEVILMATAVMTISLLVFTEVLPKVYSLKNPERVALAVAPAIKFFMLVFLPITFIVDFIVKITLRAFGLEKHGMEGVVHGLDALRGTIELHHEEGGMVKEDKDMLGGILDLDNLEVGEIMQHRKDMQAIDIATPSEEIIKQMLKSQYSRVPVYSENSDNIVGILYAKNLMKALAEGGEAAAFKIDIKSLLIEPWFVPESTSLKDQLIAFRSKRQHFALVVDEYGSILGMITLEDILEEIVGNIEDGHDNDLHKIEDLLDGSYIIDGTIPIRDLNREMHWNLPVDNANTIAGLIISEAEMIPSKSQIFNFYGFRFEILKKKRNQIVKIKISKI